MKHTYKTPHSFDGENDFELSILYNYSPGAPQLGPSYSSGGEPAESPEIDVLGVMVNDRAATPEQWDQVVENERLYNEMALNAADYIAAAAAEYRAEKRMNNMLAYHNDPAIKSKLLADLQAHADADLLIKGQYWQNGKRLRCRLYVEQPGRKEYFRPRRIRNPPRHPANVGAVGRYNL